MLPLEAPCPCQSKTTYGHCCQPYHAGTHLPTEAEQLMRSRYSAYVLGLADYLIKTTHREHPQYRKNTALWREEIVSYCNQATFTQLNITAIKVINPDEALVTFEAQFLLNETPTSLNETSHFKRIGARWLYHSGVLDNGLSVG